MSLKHPLPKKKDTAESPQAAQRRNMIISSRSIKKKSNLKINRLKLALLRGLLKPIDVVLLQH